MLIADARGVLLRTALAEAQANPLIAAFVAWLLRSPSWKKQWKLRRRRLQPVPGLSAAQET